MILFLAYWDTLKNGKMGKSMSGFTVLACCFLLLACAGKPVVPDSSRSFQVLSINDVYRIEGVDNQSNGGLARVRSLRRSLEAEGKPVLLLLAGDFLFPSSVSRLFYGEQMVDTLNLLDGAARDFDKYMFVTFGNHEFDRKKLKDAANLQARIRQSQFSWLHSNIYFTEDRQLKPLIHSNKLARSRVVKINGIKVGIFSLTTGMAQPAYADIDTHYTEVARETVKHLRARGAEVVLALTHLPVTEDEAIIKQLGEDGPDYIFGGHEHSKQYRCEQQRCVIKADLDARSAVVATVSVDKAGKVNVQHRYEELNRTTHSEDSLVKNRVERWLAQYEATFCRNDNQPDGCLQVALGKTKVELVGEELEFRRYETNLGGWIAAEALKAFKNITTPAGSPQIAFYNAGSIRLNQNIPADTNLTTWHINEMFQYPITLRVVKIPGKVLQQVVNHAVQDWTGAGWWLQIAGFAFKHDINSGKASELHLIDHNGHLTSIGHEDSVVAVVGDYLVNPGGNQDGYTMLKPEYLVPYDNPLELRTVVIDAIKAASHDGIEPKARGNICSSDRPLPCLLQY